MERCCPYACLFLLLLSLQIERLENSEHSHNQKNSSAMFKCVVRLEVKGCDFFCDGSGCGGDRSIIQQGIVLVLMSFRVGCIEMNQEEAERSFSDWATVSTFTCKTHTCQLSRFYSELSRFLSFKTSKNRDIPIF